MKKFKFLFLMSILILGFLLSWCSKQANVIDNQQTSDCQSLCDGVSSICPSLIDKNLCESKCPEMNKEKKDHLMQSQSCEELSQRQDLISDLLIPELNQPEEKVSTNACETACGAYVGKCLTLVPNATQALFDDGYNSCLQECEKRDVNKVNCMVGASDCETMTEVCGL
jgi:hypothetical protein